jgi:hypothetical protein
MAPSSSLAVSRGRRATDDLLSLRASCDFPFRFLPHFGEGWGRLFDKRGVDKALQAYSTRMRATMVGEGGGRLDQLSPVGLWGRRQDSGLRALLDGEGQADGMWKDVKVFFFFLHSAPVVQHLQVVFPTWPLLTAPSLWMTAHSLQVRVRGLALKRSNQGGQLSE